MAHDQRSDDEDDSDERSETEEWGAVAALWSHVQSGSARYAEAAGKAIRRAKEAEDAAKERARSDHDARTKKEKDAADRLAFSVDRFLPLGDLFDASTTDTVDASVRSVFSQFSHGRFGPRHFIALADVIYGSVANSAVPDRVFSSSGHIDSPAGSHLNEGTLEQLTTVQCFLRSLKAEHEPESFFGFLRQGLT